MTTHPSKFQNAFIHETAIVDEDVQIGDGTKIWYFSHILQNVTIGFNCNIGQNVVVGPDAVIGNNCKIQNNVSVYKGVTLEDDVFCGPSMVFTNVFNPRAHIKKMDELRQTRIKQGASLGANCTIICGVTVGRFAFVGAGAVVTKDVPDHALVVGNPARQAGWVCECGEKLEDSMVCKFCKKKYESLITKEILDKREDQNPIVFVDLSAQQKDLLPKIEKNISAVLKHGQYIMGPEVQVLEKQLAAYVEVKHAITCSSGTDAILMALMAYGIGPGDAVFTTPFTFIATAEVIFLLGATPVFVDIDPVSFNIAPDKLKKQINAVLDCKFCGRSSDDLTPKAVIPVDLFGLPCDYDQISEIALEYNLVVIEDAAQSFGGEYKGAKAGSLGHVGCTSFFPAKPLGCYGDGGALFTDSDEIAEKVHSIRVHGKGENKYVNIRIGLNARLDTLQAAILLAKFEIFQQEVEKRRELAEIYSEKLSGATTKLIPPNVPKGCRSAWAQYSVLSLGMDIRDHIQKGLKEKNIPSAVYYPIPLHLQPVFFNLGYEKGDFPVAEDVSSRIFSLPMHPYLTLDNQTRICSEICSLL